MNRTLQEELKGRIGTKECKIGCKGGSGFVYCGKLSPTIYKTLKGIDYRRKAKLKSDIELNQDYLDNIDEFWNSKVKNFQKILDPEWRKKAIKERQPCDRKKKERELKKRLKTYDDDLAKLIAKKQTTIDTRTKKIAFLQRQLDNYIPLLERQVKEIYKISWEDEKNCVVILVEGNDKGAYWTIAEYQKKTAPKQKENKILNEW